MPREDWSASAELGRMKAAGITGPRNPVTRRVANRELLDMARTPGAMGAMGSSPLLGPTEGRTRLNSLSSADFLGENRMSRTANRRTAAATGSDAQWALPKLHDPFEYWRDARGGSTWRTQTSRPERSVTGLAFFTPLTT